VSVAVAVWVAEAVTEAVAVGVALGGTGVSVAGIGVSDGIGEGVSVANCIRVGITRVGSGWQPATSISATPHKEMNVTANKPGRFLMINPLRDVADVSRARIAWLWLTMITLLCAACQSPRATPLSPFLDITQTGVTLPTNVSDSAQALYTPTAAVSSAGGDADTAPAPVQTLLLPLSEFGEQAREQTPDTLFSPPADDAISDIHPEEIIGYSFNGLPISAHTFGTGERALLLVGGMHGGYEANTVVLVRALMAHFERTPSDIRPGVRLIVIPAANPDGLALGTGFDARFNGGGVDLNRNWGCGWSRDAVWRDQPVDPGGQALSEPETRAMAAYIQRVRPAAVLFYHSAAGGVFEGDCQGARTSRIMAAVYGEASGYAYGQPFSAYPVTGTAAAWVDGIGIPSADVELFTRDDPEFDRNLRAVNALQDWLIGQ
jgi:hypothetical protein